MTDRRRLLVTVMGGKAKSSLLTGIVSYWNLNEASDASGAVTRSDSCGTNHLTDNGTTPSTPGLIGNGALFTAAKSEYLSIASNASLQMGGSDFTITAKVKLTNTTSVHELVNKYNSYGSNQREYALSYNYNSVGYVENRFVFIVSATGSSTAVKVFASAMGEPVAGVIYHLKCWFDNTLKKIFISVNNGTPESTSCPNGVFSGSSPFIIGGLPAANRYSSAMVDEVGLWKRLLTTAEDTTIYNGGNGKTYPFDSRSTVGQAIFDGN
jgi:hypothetical protein